MLAHSDPTLKLFPEVILPHEILSCSYPISIQTPCLRARRSVYDENRLVTFAMTVGRISNVLPTIEIDRKGLELTVQSNHRDDESNAQNHHHKRVDLQSGRLVGVEFCEGTHTLAIR